MYMLPVGTNHPFMPLVRFTAQFARTRDTPDLQADSATLREVVESVLARRPILCSYLLDDQGSRRSTRLSEGNLAWQQLLGSGRCLDQGRPG